MTSNNLTEQCLGIFWDGEEVDGLTVYGYYQTELVECLTIANQDWPEGCISERKSELRGKGWYVCIWDIKINIWPPVTDWERIIRTMLNRIIETGAKIGWCGLEGGFVNPPDLFNPRDMSGCVWAAMTDDKHFYLHAALSKEFKALTDGELNMLYEQMLSPTDQLT